MSQPALQRLGADLEQAAEELTAACPPQAEPETDDVDASTREARRLADLAASFCLFGLRIDQLAWTAPGWDAAADAPYRIAEAPEAAPANDASAATSRCFPELARRGLHVEPRYAIRLIQAVDWVVIALAAQAAALWGAGLGLAELPLGQALAFVASALSLKFGLWLTETYRVTPRRIRPERSLGGLALGAITGLVVANLLAADARSAAALAAIIPATAMLLALAHGALAVWIGAAHRKGVFSETLVLVGATPAAERLAARAAKTGEARIVAIVDDRLSRAPEALASAPVGGSLDDLLAWEGLPHVDRIVITVTQKAEARVRAMIERLRSIPNRVDLLLDYDTQSVRGGRVERFGGGAVACVSGRPHSARRAMIKRAQDLVLGALLLIAFALPMLTIAVAVKLDSKGPVLFRQRRHGFNNRVITVLKFRTMKHAPGAPLRQVRANDPRVTRIGAFLRRTSLDELPQLINVLRGEMSLVGPRPHAIGMKAAERDLEHIVAEYAHRHRVKPGITGWAQVNGSRGPIETAPAVRRRLKLDLEYVSRASLWLDLQILARTAPVLFGDRQAAR
ncbi:MAG TPA: exopolysaccharide biosynthesis polyprenyl glycosylphosphotransferase [Vitreimonas sp.]|uniref:exopolysaccharide biosynthesis polyprenyl glycosylphosphotransferase n=1 Tax=Vitreimonas sp. TaxID=3069702 RepID=UPI002D61CC99|nr:exopolysaccharide biosynthesis polyprenyl glycosylphosphotransferase [Vitreimonas sp.]HYD86886.1 exopolysaccharide biosynthesis polyprenyl glycosylphosphotransferase [Vitreimonas sp.]